MPEIIKKKNLVSYSNAFSSKRIMVIPKSKLAMDVWLQRLHKLDRLYYTDEITEEEAVRRLGDFELYFKPEEEWVF